MRDAAAGWLLDEVCGVFAGRAAAERDAAHHLLEHGDATFVAGGVHGLVGFAGRPRAEDEVTAGRGIRGASTGEFWGGLDETRELIRSLDLASRVELRPGYVPAADVPGLFAAADALVLPYRTATASQNVWMAFEHGLPVIATDVGGFADQIRDGVDGLICEPGDVSSLAGALNRFYASGEPERLRSGVRPVDHGPVWAAYLDALTGAAR